jgi:hypothetical protein
MRRGGAEFTQMMREQYDTLRQRQHGRLAERVIRTVGKREYNGTRYLFLGDISRRECMLLKMAGELKAWWTGEERREVYRSTPRLGTAIATIILKSAGHPADEVDVDLDGETYRALVLS